MPALQQGLEETGGVGGLAFSYLLRGAGDQDLAAARAALRPQIHHPVGGFHHIQIVLYDDDGVAVIPQLVQYLQQLLDVVEVQPRGRFIQNIQGLAGVAARELAGELDPLRLAAGEGGGRLS